MEEIDINQLRALFESKEITKNVMVDVPFLGKVSLNELEKYLPYYVKMRKDLREFVPVGVDRAIMEYAERKGLVDPRPQKLEDIDRPLAQIEKDISVYLTEGWSVTQIAKKMGIYPAVVLNLKEKVEKEAAEHFGIKRWILRKVINMCRRHL